jgi:hypothetical protein
MSLRLEAFLARIYVDEQARDAFLADPDGETTRAGLDVGERAALRAMEPVNLRLATEGFACKRAHKPRRHVLYPLYTRLRDLFQRNVACVIVAFAAIL